MFQQIQEFLSGPIGSGVVNLLIALLILIVGYIVARIIASIVRRLLKRTGLDNRIAAALTEPGKEKFNIEDIKDIIGKVVFWILMLFVLVAFLERLGLVGISAPISTFLNQLTSDYLPRLGAAALLLFVAWLVATALRFLVRKGAALAKFDERLTKYGAIEEREQVAISEPLSSAVFWFVFLLFLPAVLDALGIARLADPIQGIFDQILQYVPNVLGAAVILLIGWFGARIIRQIVTNLLAAVGVDKYGQRAGMSEERSLSEVIGNVLYIFILSVVIISALDQLNIEAISGPTTEMLNTIVNIIPSILGAAVVLIVAYAIARVVSNLVGDLLANVSFNGLPEKLGLGWGGERTPSEWVGSLTLIVIMIFAATSAAEILGSQFLVNALNVFIAFLWKVLLALVIVAIGLYFANLIYKAVSASKTHNAMLLARLSQVAVVVFSTAMGLRTLGIADDIVDLAFGIILGAIGVAVAIAFGLGSREIAGREVERLINSMRASAEDEGGY
jgi:hypothetical protein